MCAYVELPLVYAYVVVVVVVPVRSVGRKGCERYVRCDRGLRVVRIAGRRRQGGQMDRCVRACVRKFSFLAAACGEYVPVRMCASVK